MKTIEIDSQAFIQEGRNIFRGTAIFYPKHGVAEFYPEQSFPNEIASVKLTIMGRTFISLAQLRTIRRSPKPAYCELTGLTPIAA